MDNIFIKKIKKYSLNEDKIAYHYIEEMKVIDTITYKDMYSKYLYYLEYFNNLELTNKFSILYMTAGVNFMPILLACIDAGIKPILKTIGESVSNEKLFGQLIEIKKEMPGVGNIITNYNYPNLKEKAELLEFNYIDLENDKSYINYRKDNFEINGDIILLTSGSTKFSKGVIISISQLLENTIFCKNLWNINEDDICLDWMPHSHIYGLVTGYFLPIYTGGISYIMNPKEYAKNFNNFFKCLDKYKITHTHTPASNMFLESGAKVDDFNIKLDSIKTISLGGEAINYSLLEKFNQRYNLKRNIFSPNYGMSEISGLLCAIKSEEDILVTDVDQNELKFNNKISLNSTFNTCRLVSVGSVNKEETLIVEPDTFNLLNDFEIGEIVIHVKSISNGYINKEDNVSFVEYNGLTYYRTGDLGFINSGYLTVTGRLKEIVKVKGKNISPYEIENTIIISSFGDKIKNIVAFARKENITDEEEIGLLIETNLDNEFVDDIIKLVKDTIQVKIKKKNVLFLKKNTIPRFSNGKISRKNCNKYFKELARDENEKN